MGIKIDWSKINFDVPPPSGTPACKPIKNARDMSDEALITVMTIDTLPADLLDTLAKQWGLVRKSGTAPDCFGFGGTHTETDDELRVRIRTMAMGDDSGGYASPNMQHFGDIDIEVELPEGYVPGDGREIKGTKYPTKTMKCECGAAALGYAQPGPGHASWCPIASK